ncbi:MAG: thiol peroxidase [Planctomycetes bacterium]|nr:thiol peroxidase [Planctomycetota bacterium]
MAQERTGAIKLKGNPMTLVGPALKPGDVAPEFECINQSLEPVTLASSRGKVRLIAAVPSLDTPVCDVETKRFAAEIAELPPNVQFYTVSADLHFAQKRWCGAANVQVPTISDHRKLSFAEAYGVLIKELRILARAVFVVDAQDRIAYVEIVPEVAQEPNYEKALQAARQAAGAG